MCRPNNWSFTCIGDMRSMNLCLGGVEHNEFQLLSNTMWARWETVAGPAYRWRVLKRCEVSLLSGRESFDSKIMELYRALAQNKHDWRRKAVCVVVVYMCAERFSGQHSHHYVLSVQWMLQILTFRFTSSLFWCSFLPFDPTKTPASHVFGRHRRQLVSLKKQFWLTLCRKRPETQRVCNTL